MNRWYGKETLEEQKRLTKWTKRMAIGAFAAALLTAVYVYFTWNILHQAREDSELELRPYVMVESVEIDTMYFKASADSFNLEFHLKIALTNPGKTPAVNFRHSGLILPEKELYFAPDQLVYYSLDSSFVRSALFGNIPISIDCSFNLTIPINDRSSKNCCITQRDISYYFFIENGKKLPLYYHGFYKYTNHQESNTYFCKYRFCFLYAVSIDETSVLLRLEKVFVDEFSMSPPQQRKIEDLFPYSKN